MRRGTNLVSPTLRKYRTIMQKALTAVSYHWMVGRLENTPTYADAM